MDQDTKENLILQFRSYLDHAGDEFAATERPDLYSLLSEFTALKNEVKIESRLIKKAGEEVQHTASLVERNNQAIAGWLEQGKATAAGEIEKEILVPIFDRLLDLYDRFTAAEQATPSNGSAWGKWLCRKETTVIEAMQDGQKMLLDRLKDILLDCRIYPIESMGRPFDPRTMRAVTVDNAPGMDDGVVSGELRKGFTWKGELLRAAEVQVNRQNNQQSENNG